MNCIGIGDWDHAVALFFDGASIRQVVREVGISRETAHRIQKAVNLNKLNNGELIRVNTGKNSKGEVTFYETSHLIPTWKRKPHSGDTSCEAW